MIKFNGLDRIYDAYSWRITHRAKQVWKTGNVVGNRHVEGSYVDQFETSVAKYTKRKYPKGCIGLCVPFAAVPGSVAILFYNRQFQTLPGWFQTIGHFSVGLAIR